MIKKLKNNKGFVMLFTAILSSIVLAIALGVANIALKEIKFGTSAKSTNEAFFAADAGVECALFNDKTGGDSFVSGGSGTIECLGETISLTESPTDVWSFVMTGLGASGEACAKVLVDKTAYPTVNVTSEGYNTGDALCESSSPLRVERELAVAFNEPENDAGKIYIGGFFTAYQGIMRNRLARLNSDGSLDTAFDPVAGPDNYVKAIAVQDDGKILIGGYFETYAGAPAVGLARINPDGSLDTSFNQGTGINGTFSKGVESIVIQNDGKIIIGGGFNSYNGVSRNRIARINPDGSLDTSFNPGNGADSAVLSLALQDDGKVLIGGSFSFYNDVGRNRIARVNTDGSLDTSFNPNNGANNHVFAIDVQSDGKVFIGGGFTMFDDTPRGRIARLDGSGAIDNGWNPGEEANNSIRNVWLQNDGKILITGDFTNFNGYTRNRIARVNTDTSVDTTFDPGSGTAVSIQTSSLQTDGKLVIGGNFTIFNSVSRIRIARLNTDGSVDGSFDPVAGADNIIYSIAIVE